MAVPLVFTGNLELDLRLQNLGEKVPVKAIKAGVNGGLTPIVKAIKRGVAARNSNAKDAKGHASLQSAAIASVDKSVKKIKKGDLKGQSIARAGFGAVRGKKRKKAVAASVSSQRTGLSSRGGGGVGISAQNIHWAVLGTKERVQKETGRVTGAMPAVFKGVVQQAFENSKKASLEGSRKAIERVIIRESKKKG